MTTRKLKPREIKRAMRLFILEGMFSKITDRLFSPFFVPFLISMSYSNFEIGMINAAIYLALVATKIPGSYIVRGRHKDMVLLGAGIFRTGIALLPIIAYIFPSAIPVAIAIFVMYAGAELSGLAFTVWFNSLIPERYRNRYRNKRATMMRLISIPMMLVASFLIRGRESPLAYFILFLVAFLAGMVSLYLLSTIPYRRIVSRKRFRFQKGLMPFLAYEALFRFGVGLSSSFTAVYFMKVLGKDIVWVIMLSFLVEIASFFVLKSQKAGRIADMNGSRAGMQMASFMIAFLPILYLVSFNYLLLGLAAIVSGISWSMMQTFRFDYIVRKSRDVESGFAIADTTRNLFTAIGSFAGGAIASASIAGINGVVALFFMASAVRFSAFLLSLKLPRIRGEMGAGKIIKDMVDNILS